MSESGFDHANRILCLKVTMLVFLSVKVVNMSGLSIDHLLIYARFTGRFLVVKPTAQSSVPQRARGQLGCV